MTSSHYNPPFGLKGLRADTVLAEANPSDFREVCATFSDNHDRFVAFVDSLSSLDQDATVAEHLAASEDKIRMVLMGNKLVALYELGAFFGPLIVSSSASMSDGCTEHVRIGLYVPAGSLN